MNHTDIDEYYIQNLLIAVKCLAKRAKRERKKKEVCQKKIDELMEDLKAAIQIIEYYEDGLQMQNGGAVCGLGDDLFNGQRKKLPEH